MTSKFVEELVAELTLVAHSAPSAFEFEMAYQCRVACDRIRFAIRNIEPRETGPGALRDSCLQLMEALGRLENVERRFLSRSGRGTRIGSPDTTNAESCHSK
jgi:hypothetical protein